MTPEDILITLEKLMKEFKPDTELSYMHDLYKGLVERRHGSLDGK